MGEAPVERRPKARVWAAFDMTAGYPALLKKRLRNGSNCDEPASDAIRLHDPPREGALRAG
jgi:hypothetical protein